MRRIILLNIFVLIINFCFSQFPGYTELNLSESLRQEIKNVSESIFSIKADFIQDKKISMLDEKMISNGFFYYKKSGNIRMEYSKPFKFLLVLSNNKMYLKNAERVNTFKESESKLFKSINKLMASCIDGSWIESGEYKSKYYQSKNQILVELFPLNKELSKLYKSIIVTIDKKDFTVAVIEMNDISGDQTKIKFINKEINVQIPDTVFNVN